MSDDKRKALEAAGWKFGSVHEFLEEPKMNVAAAVSDSISIARATAARPEDYQRAACVLSAEVERLRAEIQRLDIAGTHSCHDDCPKLPCVQRREIERLRAELAEAKAASVCPVDIVWFYQSGWGQYANVELKSEEDAVALMKWLRDRMKERGEG